MTLKKGRHVLSPCIYEFFFVYLVIFSLTLSSFAFIFSLVSFTVVFVCIGACVVEKKIEKRA